MVLTPSRGVHTWGMHYPVDVVLTDAVGRVVNVGSTQEVSIMELAETVLRLSGSDSKIELVPYEKAYPTDFEDMRRRVPDVSLLLKLTGKAPRARLDEIVDSVIRWARQTAV